MPAATKLAISLSFSRWIATIGTAMETTASPADPEHPLRADRGFLDEVRVVMYAKIHKVLGWPNPGLVPASRRLEGSGREERALVGTGVSADDILADALVALLEFPPNQLRGSWRALAVIIARNKAIEALRTAGKGLRGTDHRPEFHLVSGDAEGTGPDGTTQKPILEVLPAEWADLETEYFALLGVEDLKGLARQLLDETSLDVYFAVHFEGYSRVEVGAVLQCSPQRAGQIYKAAVHRLRADSRYPYPITTHTEDEGTSK